ncbi:hypothetical protein BDR03DRAFT_975405 [Suillus americanus]|nr:hypothetical protein BDR03DRAFT_975405 [Suillus americanus]
MEGNETQATSSREGMKYMCNSTGCRRTDNTSQRHQVTVSYHVKQAAGECGRGMRSSGSRIKLQQDGLWYKCRVYVHMHDMMNY